MTKRSEDRLLEVKKRNWDLAISEWNKFWSRVWREIKIIFKDMNNFLMYYKRPTDKMDRIFHSIEWWFCIFVIFFAIKGFIYTLTGR